MSIYQIVFQMMGRFKYGVIILFVAVTSYLVAKRWSYTFDPWYLYVGLAVGITIVIIVVYEIVKRRRGRKMAADFEAGIAQAEEEKVDLKGEVKALRDNWESSLAKLKASKLGGGVALQQLPWYMIIGEPASGKSTLLRKSGLDFPVGDAAVAGLHGTRNCDWWFANEAIFLDTAGRYIIESKDAEWVAFLELLRKYRKKKPVNGVLVAVAANSLLTKSHDDLLLDGKRIRTRIDELIEKLGTNFPVYVLVTKCDLVSGFVEFFGSLDARYREQMLGWTVPADDAQKFTMEEFDRRFEEVSEKLFLMRPWLESAAGKRDLMKAFLFPEEFAYLGQPLREVLDVVFKQNVYQETPVCRGVYFSSGTQVGSPLARALEDMAKDLSIPADFGFGLSLEEEKEVRAYFIKDLVGEQILKDKEMNWRTWHHEARLRKRRRNWGILGLAAASLLGILATSSFLTNQGRLSTFKVAIPEDGRPLEVAVGCLETYRGAADAGLLDVGLNYNDQIKPALLKSFFSVFGNGCVKPLLTHFRDRVREGIPEKDGVPDLDAYFREYYHYLFLRSHLVKEGEVFDAEHGADHLRALFGVLSEKRATGREDEAGLKAALSAYRARADSRFFLAFAGERREIERAHLENLGRWLRDVRAWQEENQAAGGRRVEGLKHGVEGLARTCERILANREITPHEDPDTVVELAKEIRMKGSPYGVESGTTRKLTSLAAGVSLPDDLRELLVKARPTAAGDEPTEKEIDALAAPLSSPENPELTEAREKALVKILQFLDNRVIRAEIPEKMLFSTTKFDVLRDEISRMVARTGETSWREIRGAVETIAGGPVEEKGKEGRTVPKEGWWRALPLLARARTADLLKDEYIEATLVPWFEQRDGKWMKRRSRERPAETYSVERIEGRILPDMRKHLAFFSDELTATSLREEAVKRMTDALLGYLKDMGGFWDRYFGEKALPPKTATTLAGAYDQFDEFTDDRGDLLKTCRRIQEAVEGIDKLEGSDDDPLLLETEEARRELFANFVVCFDSDAPEVSEHYTVHDAAKDLDGIRRDLRAVAGRRGTDTEAARAVVEAEMKGIGRESSFARAEDAAKELRKSNPDSRPARLTADWLDGLVANSWAGLVELAAKDINDAWARNRAKWSTVVASQDTVRMLAVFRKGGEFDDFCEKTLQPFFRMPGYQPKEVKGVSLSLVPGFQQFMQKVAYLVENLLGPDGNFVSDQMTVGLNLGGQAAPASLVIEYKTDSGTIRSPEFRNFGRVTFDLEWSPGKCRGLEFLVGFEGGEKLEDLSWTGRWAVADAFLDPRCRFEGGKWIWRAEHPRLGIYEVILDVKGTTRLIDYRRRPGGMLSSLPAEAVRVER